MKLFGGLFGGGGNEGESGASKEDREFVAPGSEASGTDDVVKVGADQVEVVGPNDINLVPEQGGEAAGNEAQDQVVTDKNDPNYDAFAALNMARSESAAEGASISAERKAGVDALAAQEPSMRSIDSDDIHAAGAEALAGQAQSTVESSPVPEQGPDESDMQAALDAVDKLNVTGNVEVISGAAVTESAGEVVEGATIVPEAAPESPIAPMGPEGEEEVDKAA